MNPSEANTAKNYPVEIRPLSADEGGGWLASFPDLPGCMGDGATPEAAIADAYEAAAAWLAVAQAQGDVIPQPGAGGESGRFVARLPKSLHTRLVARAEQEGVSMNTLVVSLIAQGVGAIIAPPPSVKSRRIGTMEGRLKVPADFDAMGSETIANLFEGGTR
jgi:antitoxin HicB